MLPGEKRRIPKWLDDINDPLAAIRTALFLAGAHSEDDKVRNYLNLAEEQAFSIVRIVRHLVHGGE